MSGRCLLALIVAGVVACVVGRPGVAAADAPHVTAVAMLPLDAPDRLALYGQPVAATLATGLRDAGIEVDVVGPGAPVPTRARLVIDGTLRREGETVRVKLRVRDPARGVEVGALGATAATLTGIDATVRELQAQLVPLVQRLLAPPPSIEPAPPIAPPLPIAPAPRTTAIVSSLPVDVGGIGTSAATSLGARLRHYLAATRRGPVMPGGAAWRLELEIRDVTGGTVDGVPVARARVRARLLRDGVVAFERVAHTDTIVGPRAASPGALVDALARQLVDVLAPRLRAVLGVAP